MYIIYIIYITIHFAIQQKLHRNQTIPQFIFLRKKLLDLSLSLLVTFHIKLSQYIGEGKPRVLLFFKLKVGGKEIKLTGEEYSSQV